MTTVSSAEHTRRDFLYIATGAIGAVGMAPVTVQAATVYIQAGPPPVREEVVPGPRRGYVWAPGHYEWRGHRHVWVRGYWVKERRGYAYVPHRWVDDGGRWHQEPGHWGRP